MDREPEPLKGPPGQDPLAALDLLIGTTVVAAVCVSLVGRRAARLVGGLARVVPGPRLRTPWRQDGRLDSLAHLGREQRHAAMHAGSAVLDRLVPTIVDATLQRLDLTTAIAEHVEIDALVGIVDLDQVVANVDIDAIAARLDLEAVVKRLDRVRHTEE
jgi:hypothetical protein